MGRLVDADKLIEFIDVGHLRHSGEMCFSELDVVNMLNHAPTAYKPDKVVEQLEDYLFEKYCVEGDSKIDEIVKGGGVNE